MFLLLCMCFPFMYGRDDNTLFATRSLLCIPSIKSNSYGGRAFSAAAPELWNSIPEYIKRAETVETFKTRLKTFLFEKHYWAGWIGLCKSADPLKLMAESVDPLKKSVKSESANCLPRSMIGEIQSGLTVVGVALNCAISFFSVNTLRMTINEIFL